VNRRTDLLRCRCHRRLGRFFVLRDAGGIRHLGKPQGLDLGDMTAEVRVSIRKSLQRLPYGVIGIEHSFDGQIHGQLVLLFRVHFELRSADSFPHAATSYFRGGGRAGIDNFGLFWNRIGINPWKKGVL
jgi:hypothetical protein